MSQSASLSDVLSTQMSALPPHLKMRILQQAQQQAQQTASNAAAATATATLSSSTVSASSVSDALADPDARVDPSIPPPFVLPAGGVSSLAPPPPNAFFSDAMIESLATHGFIVVDGFDADAAGQQDSGTDLPSALQEARGLYAGQHMMHAGMKAAIASSSASVSSDASASASASAWKSSALRGDHHLWLHVSDATERARMPAVHAVLRQMDALRVELNARLKDESADASVSAVTSAASSRAAGGSGTGWRASPGSQVQLASYQGGGARYVKHRDSIPGQPPYRRLTCIVYLSQWERPEQGGCLRLYTKPTQSRNDGQPHTLPYFDRRGQQAERPVAPPASSIFMHSLPGASDPADAAPASSPPASSRPRFPALLDVAPLSGRLLLFSSAELLHEVLPSFDLQRYAITMWME